LIQPIEVSQENGASMVRRGRGPIEEDIFAIPIVCAQPDDVALIGGDVDQLVLPVEATEGGVALADRLARFDRDRDR